MLVKENKQRVYDVVVLQHKQFTSCFGVIPLRKLKVCFY